MRFGADAYKTNKWLETAPRGMTLAIGRASLCNNADLRAADVGHKL